MRSPVAGAGIAQYECDGESARTGADGEPRPPRHQEIVKPDHPARDERQLHVQLDEEIEKVRQHEGREQRDEPQHADQHDARVDQRRFQLAPQVLHPLEIGDQIAQDARQLPGLLAGCDQRHRERREERGIAFDRLREGLSGLDLAREILEDSGDRALAVFLEIAERRDQRDARFDRSREVVTQVDQHAIAVRDARPGASAADLRPHQQQLALLERAVEGRQARRALDAPNASPVKVARIERKDGHLSTPS
jgi:hypothetical protein